MSVKVLLEGDGLLYSAEASVFQAGQIIAFLNNGDALQPTTQAHPMVPAQPRAVLESDQRTLKEVFDQSGAASNPQKLAAAGYHITVRDHKGTFTGDEVRAVFRKAGELVPRNFSRDIGKATDAGYIHLAEGKRDEFYVTEAGERFIRDGFPKTDKKSSVKTGTKVRRVTAQRERVDVELNKKLKDNSQSLKDFVAKRRVAFDAKATQRAAIIATWLLDELQQDGVSSGDLYTVYLYLGEPAGNTASQLVNGKARDGFFGHSESGRYFLSSRGEDYGRHKSLG